MPGQGPISPISKDEFEKLAPSSQNSIMYGYILDIHATCLTRSEHCGLVLKKSRRMQNAIAGFFGLIGGFMAWFMGACKP